MKHRTFIALAALLFLLPAPSRARKAGQPVAQADGGSMTTSIDPTPKAPRPDGHRPAARPPGSNRRTIYTEGTTAAFFRGAPNGSVVPYWDYRLLPDLERSGFTRKRDDVLLFNAAGAYEITYKRRVTAPRNSSMTSCAATITASRPS